MKKAFTILAFLVLSLVSYTQLPGDPDLSFGDNGVVKLDVQGWNDFYYDVCLQSNGKIIAAGRMESETGNDLAVISRFNSDGSLDFSFATNGHFTDQVTLLDCYNAVTIQDDGKIVFGGYSINEGSNWYYGIVGRLLPTGQLDATFASGSGMILGDQIMNKINDVIVTADGRIICCGEKRHSDSDTRGAIACLTSTGVWDNSFGTDGYTELTSVYGNSTLKSIDIMDDGSILSGGYLDGMDETYLLTKLDNTGGFDFAFGNGAGVHWLEFSGISTAKCAALTVQDDGLIMTCGYGYNYLFNDYDIVTARVDQNGTLDPDYGVDGKRVININDNNEMAMCMAIEENNDIIIGGYTNAYGTYDLLLLSLDSEGQINTDFGFNGIVVDDLGGNDQIQGITIQEDEKILVAGFNNEMNIGGESDFVLARYYSGLEVGLSEATQPVLDFTIIPNPIINRNINIEVKSSTLKSIEVINSSGQIVKKQEANQYTNTQSIKVNLPSNTPSGLYWIKIFDTFENCTYKKVVVL